MKFSQSFIPTLKEVPAEATLKSHILMIRAGMIRPVSSGLYAYLPYGLAIIEKIKNIVREEMNAKGALEFTMPILVPKQLLDKSQRWEVFKSELFRLQDRNASDLALAPTNEENFTQMVLDEVSSYRQFPINFYQINYKFRDEIRPRYGVIRSKEFLMKDAYSFHLNETCLDDTYHQMDDAYRRVFQRCHLDFIVVQADSGTMGGSQSQEFMVKSEVGEEFIVYCKKPSCGYAANIESARETLSPVVSPVSSTNCEKVFTPNTKTIAEVSQFLQVPQETIIKTLVYEIKQEHPNSENQWHPMIVLIRGDYEVHPTKLENCLSKLGVSEFRIASQGTVEKLFQTPNIGGYLGVKGISQLKQPVTLLVDVSLEGLHSAVVGANQVDHHYLGFDLWNEITDHPHQVVELYTAKEGGQCPQCSSPLSLIKGIEVGHIFKLGRKYTQAFNIKILDETSQSVVPTMGCYGIGVSRVLAACIEQLSDDHGCILPFHLAPYKVVVITLNLDDSRVMDFSQQLYDQLTQQGYSPLWDERDERPGPKFKDADLLGIPLQVIVGKKGLDKGRIEVRVRTDLKSREKITDLKSEVDSDKVLEHLRELRNTLQSI